MKTLLRPLAGLTVKALVGDFVPPLAGLAVDVGQVGERAQGPEIAADISDVFFDFPFLPGGRRACRSEEKTGTVERNPESGG